MWQWKCDVDSLRSTANRVHVPTATTLRRSTRYENVDGINVEIHFRMCVMPITILIVACCWENEAIRV